LIAAAICVPVLYQALNIRSSGQFGAPRAAGLANVAIPGAPGEGPAAAPAAPAALPQNPSPSIVRMPTGGSGTERTPADETSASTGRGRTASRGDSGAFGESADERVSQRPGGVSGGALAPIDRSLSPLVSDPGAINRYRGAWTNAEQAIAQQRVPARLRAYVRRYFTALRAEGQP